MLGAVERQQGFFDAAWCVGLLPEGSIYSLLSEHGERIVRDEDFADCYSERHGRPSIPPSMLAKVLLLAYRDGLSDERALEAVRFDLRWKIALDLPVDHPGFSPHEPGSVPRSAFAAWQGAVGVRALARVGE